MTIPLDAALHMSYTVSAATDAAVIASISTPVPAGRAAAASASPAPAAPARLAAPHTRGARGARGDVQRVRGGVELKVDLLRGSALNRKGLAPRPPAAGGTDACDISSGWQSGMRSAVRLAASTPATRATASTSPGSRGEVCPSTAAH